MKFGETLEATLFPLWRAYYFDYAEMKAALSHIKASFPYARLFREHDVHVENDPTQPFRFLISRVHFTYRNAEGQRVKASVRVSTVRVDRRRRAMMAHSPAMSATMPNASFLSFASAVSSRQFNDVALGSPSVPAAPAAGDSREEEIPQGVEGVDASELAPNTLDFGSHLGLLDDAEEATLRASAILVPITAKDSP